MRDTLRRYMTLVAIEVAVSITACLPSWASTIVLSWVFGLEQSALAGYAVLVWVVSRVLTGALVLGVVQESYKFEE